MLMVGQLLVHVVEQQHGGRARQPPRRQVIEGIAHHDQAAGVHGAGAVDQAPALGDVHDTCRMGLRRAKVAGDDGIELGGGQEFGDEVLDGDVEVAGADGLGHLVGLEVGHEILEPWLGRLRGHGLALDGADGLVGGRLLVRGQLVDVFEDVH